jgi:uncharacterized protein GlcG (DUF336 family)
MLRVGGTNPVDSRANLLEEKPMQRRIRTIAMLSAALLIAGEALAQQPNPLDDVIASRGGIPLVEGGKLIGAIGCSGGTESQDEVVCKIGASTVKP